MRAGVLIRQAGIPFEEVTLRFDGFTPESQFKRRVAELRPAGQVPVLVDEGLAIWDTLAIAEYLAERFPDRRLWPTDRTRRARARSVCAEMHGGFSALRSACPMNIEARLPEVGALILRDKPAVRVDLSRIVDMWSGLLRDHGGPMLFGGFSIADAYYAPVVMRLLTYALPVPMDVRGYMDRVVDLPGVRSWIDEALAERDFLAFEEALSACSLSSDLSGKASAGSRVSGNLPIRAAAGSDHGSGSCSRCRAKELPDVRCRPCLFALGPTHAWASAVAADLGLSLSPLEERQFGDGERKSWPLCSVRGRDVYVLATLHDERGHSVAEKLCRLLFLLGTLRDASASRLTAVVPDPGLCTQGSTHPVARPGHDPLCRAAAGVGGGRSGDGPRRSQPCRLPERLQVPHRASAGLRAAGDGDRRRSARRRGCGGVSRRRRRRARAMALQSRLSSLLRQDVGLAFAHKHRALGQVSGDLFAGDLRGRVAVIVDDLIAAGTTLARTAQACIAHGASRVHADRIARLVRG
jgi:glutathione S-transferase